LTRFARVLCDIIDVYDAALKITLPGVVFFSLLSPPAFSENFFGDVSVALSSVRGLPNSYKSRLTIIVV